MHKFGWTISKYLLKVIMPYFLFSWLLLSVILFFQQASRFSEIFFSTTIPKNLVWQLTFALVPNVIAFTCPMAVLVGIIIGLSKLQGDSELTAIRAAGIGNFQIICPILFLGILLSLFAFVVNLRGVPLAAQIVRNVALKTALYKLESPIDPGVFNSDIAGFTVYVKNGNIETGTWENIFIFQEDQSNNQVRLITSKNGRIDSNEDLSELFLENAFVLTIPLNSEYETIKDKFIEENVGQIRFAVKTKRGELIEKITKGDKSLQELGINELARFAKENDGKERIEAEILLQRRLILSITPLIFALLGAALVLRFNRGGKGFGVFLALISLGGYYLIMLLGEQLARTKTISVLLGGFIPLLASLGVIFWLLRTKRFFFSNWLVKMPSEIRFRKNSVSKISKTNFVLDWTTGILDFDIVTNLLKYFLLTIGFLSMIFLIFTTFELWKFVGAMENGIWLLTKYLIYLLPFIYIHIAPSALLVAVLATFIIKSRQNEIVSWTSAGQSVYRLLMPCFVLMLVIGAINFILQEKIFPFTNQMQDAFREQIRGGGIFPKNDGKTWISNGRRIFSFENNAKNSDSKEIIKNLAIFEFSLDQTKINKIYKVPEAILEKRIIKFVAEYLEIKIVDGKAEILKQMNGELEDDTNLLRGLSKKPTHLSISDTQRQIENSNSDVERRNYEVAIEKKYTTLILPFVVTLFTAPFALTLGRKGRVATVGFAIGIWLVFIGLNSAFEQLGLNGSISAKIAVWSPILLFSMLGIFLISRVKT